MFSGCLCGHISFFCICIDMYTYCVCYEAYVAEPMTSVSTGVMTSALRSISIMTYCGSGSVVVKPRIYVGCSSKTHSRMIK